MHGHDLDQDEVAEPVGGDVRSVSAGQLTAAYWINRPLTAVSSPVPGDADAGDIHSSLSWRGRGVIFSMGVEVFGRTLWRAQNQQQNRYPFIRVREAR